MKIFLFLLIPFVYIFNCKAIEKDEVINVSIFGVSPQIYKEDNIQKYQRWLNIKKAFEYCIKTKRDLFFPKGIYDIGERHFPFKSNLGAKDLLDCGGITIYGEPRETIFMTSSAKGADVLQLNMIKNLTIKHIDITAVLTSNKHSGSNGISITNGWDNIVLHDIVCYNLPGIDKGSWVDGGKALTIQFGNNQFSRKGSLKATKIVSNNNAYGFRFDGRYVNEILRWNPKIDVEIEVIRSFQGVSIEFGNASDNINFENKLNMNIVAYLTDCQQSVLMARAVGGKYIYFLNMTLDKNKVLRDKRNKRWVSNNQHIYSYLGQANKYVDVSLSGNCGNVDRMIMMGAIGNVIEPFNFKNRTEFSRFTFNLSGKSTIEDFTLIEDKNRNSIHNTNLNFKKDMKNIDKLRVLTNNRVQLNVN